MGYKENLSTCIKQLLKIEKTIRFKFVWEVKSFQNEVDMSIDDNKSLQKTNEGDQH